MISKFDDIKQHLYADDTQKYVAITPKKQVQQSQNFKGVSDQSKTG